MMRSCRFIVILLLRARVLCRCNGLATIAGKYRQKFVHACGFSPVCGLPCGLHQDAEICNDKKETLPNVSSVIFPAVCLWSSLRRVRTYGTCVSASVLLKLVIYAAHLREQILRNV